MDKIKKFTIYGVLFVILCVLAIVITSLKFYEYLILVAVCLFILGVVFTRDLLSSASSEEFQYEKKVSRIIKTYAPILVKTNAIPDLTEKSVLPVSSFDDLVNAQAEVRNPVYYVRGNDSTAFYLINDNIFLIYFVRLNNTVKSELETEIENVPSSEVHLVENDEVEETRGQSEVETTDSEVPTEDVSIGVNLSENSTDNSMSDNSVASQPEIVNAVGDAPVDVNPEEVKTETTEEVVPEETKTEVMNEDSNVEIMPEN